MKRCPVCQSGAFDDAEICFGCLFRFPEQEKALPRKEMIAVDVKERCPSDFQGRVSSDSSSSSFETVSPKRAPATQFLLESLGEVEEENDADIEERCCPLKKEFELQKTHFESRPSLSGQGEITIHLRISADDICMHERPKRGTHAREKKTTSAVSAEVTPT